jgi:hypothetical protein
MPQHTLTSITSVISTVTDSDVSRAHGMDTRNDPT